MIPAVKIISFVEGYRQQATTMMQRINDEFSLPPHHPNYQRREPDHYWLAMIDDEVIGSVALLLIDDYAVLKSMFLIKSYRGKEFGIAASLLQAAIEKCNILNIRQLYLGTLGVLIAAQLFYQKSGFNKIAFQELPDSFPHNLSDDIFFSLRLPK